MSLTGKIGKAVDDFFGQSPYSKELRYEGAKRRARQDRERSARLMKQALATQAKKAGHRIRGGSR